MPTKTFDSLEIERSMPQALSVPEEVAEIRRFSSLAAALKYFNPGAEELVSSHSGAIAPEEFLTPSQFALQKLGIDCWPKMQEIFDAVERGERKILVRSCNGACKTTALAALCNWKLSQFPDSICADDCLKLDTGEAVALGRDSSASPICLTLSAE